MSDSRVVTDEPRLHAASRYDGAGLKYDGIFGEAGRGEGDSALARALPAGDELPDHYGDIWMEVAEAFRGRGFGTYLVQELKRICREGGHVAFARCNTGNVASRRTLQKAGFVPCAHLLHGKL
jgi:RimJ/RimL family protein N-acetyltransferase